MLFEKMCVILIRCRLPLCIITKLVLDEWIYASNTIMHLYLWCLTYVCIRVNTFNHRIENMVLGVKWKHFHAHVVSFQLKSRKILGKPRFTCYCIWIFLLFWFEKQKNAHCWLWTNSSSHLLECNFIAWINLKEVTKHHNSHSQIYYLVAVGIANCTNPRTLRSQFVLTAIIN